MKKISRGNLIFPAIFTGCLGLVFAIAVLNGTFKQTPMFLIALCAMSVIGYFSWKASVRNLADEVYDCGSFLLVKKSGEEVTVPLADIINVNFWNFWVRDRNGISARITLTLASPGKFGAEITFAPPIELYGLPPRSELAADLIARSNAARAGRAD